MGAALGSIIASTIDAHMPNTNGASSKLRAKAPVRQIAANAAPLLASATQSQPRPASARIDPIATSRGFAAARASRVPAGCKKFGSSLTISLIGAAFCIAHRHCKQNRHVDTFLRYLWWQQHGFSNAADQTAA